VTVPSVRPLTRHQGTQPLHEAPFVIATAAVPKHHRFFSEYATRPSGGSRSRPLAGIRGVARAAAGTCAGAAAPQLRSKAAPGGVRMTIAQRTTLHAHLVDLVPGYAVR